MAYTDIDKSDDYFNTLLYTGNGSSSRAVTGVGFQPDWMWFKRRDGSGTHSVFDIVRGTNGTVYRRLLPQDTGAEDTASGTVLAIGSDGFTLGNDSNINQNSETYVAWNWLGSNGTASNTDGSITSTVSANTTSGFSVVTTTGTGSAATIGHGLGAAPAMIIGKRRDSGSSEWRVYNKNLSSNSHILFLNNSNAEQSGNSATWNNTAPTSSVFSVGTSGDVNASGGTFVFYCFAEKKGFSKFGKYTGNGSTDGTFVYTGFKPAFVMHKRIDSTSEWFMFDNKRLGYNPDSYRIMANLSDGEANPGGYDLLSNGIKIRFTSGNVNGSGASYIYMAFAENPFVTSSGVPGLAR